MAWRDLDQDGVSDAGELFTMNQLGITSISLNYFEADYDLNGNHIFLESTYLYEDGTEGQIVDVIFDHVINEEDALTENEALFTGYSENGDDFLFGAIAQGATVMQDMMIDEVLDISIIVDGADDVTASIHDFVEDREAGNNAHSGIISDVVQDAAVEGVADVVSIDIAEIVDSNNWVG